MWYVVSAGVRVRGVVVVWLVENRKAMHGYGMPRCKFLCMHGMRYLAVKGAGECAKCVSKRTHLPVEL